MTLRAPDLLAAARAVGEQPAPDSRGPFWRRAR
jgi:hypothetical protein